MNMYVQSHTPSSVHRLTEFSTFRSRPREGEPYAPSTTGTAVSIEPRGCHLTNQFVKR